VLASLAAAATLLVAISAPAATTGGGTVVGSVTINGAGIPALNKPCASTTYRFGAVNITGVFRASNQNFVGTIKIPAGVTGGSPCENTNKGSGSVNQFSFSGSGVGTISGVCKGTFNRTLSIVTVALNCTATINGHSGSAAVAVDAQFTPTKGNGLTTNTQQASFAGIYKSS
jgi:hypothetical protein